VPPLVVIVSASGVGAILRIFGIDVHLIILFAPLLN
jgi:UDP-N-acetylglucosamine transferase subunit ALG13